MAPLKSYPYLLRYQVFFYVDVAKTLPKESHLTMSLNVYIYPILAERIPINGMQKESQIHSDNEYRRLNKTSFSGRASARTFQNWRARLPHVALTTAMNGDLGTGKRKTRKYWCILWCYTTRKKKNFKLQRVRDAK